MKHSPLLSAKSNLIKLLKTSYAILDIYISKEKANNLTIEQSCVLLPQLTPISTESLLSQNKFTSKTYENYESNLIISPFTHQKTSSKFVLKSTISAISANKETKEMPLLSEKAKLQNIIIKKLAHLKHKSNESNIMNKSNSLDKSNASNKNKVVKIEKEERVDITNISLLLEKNLTRNFTPNKAKTTDNNTNNERMNLTPQNDKSIKKTTMMKDSQLMDRSQLLKQSQLRNNKKWGNSNKVPQIELKIDFDEIKKKNYEIKLKKKNALCNKKKF